MRVYKRQLTTYGKPRRRCRELQGSRMFANFLDDDDGGGGGG
jgi:hypothetical protein